MVHHAIGVERGSDFIISVSRDLRDYNALIPDNVEIVSRSAGCDELAHDLNEKGRFRPPAGEVFRSRAEAILEEIASVPEEVMHAANTPSGRLAFGAPPFMGRMLTGELVANYVETYPHVQLRVRGAHSFQLREAIFFRDIDIGILAAPLTEPDLFTEPLLQELLYLVGKRQVDPIWFDWSSSG